VTHRCSGGGFGNESFRGAPKREEKLRKNGQLGTPAFRRKGKEGLWKESRVFPCRKIVKLEKKAQDGKGSLEQREMKILRRIVPGRGRTEKKLSRSSSVAKSGRVPKGTHRPRRTRIPPSHSQTY